MEYGPQANRSRNGGMNDKRMWSIAWAAVSALWLLYWIAMSLALGMEAMRDMIAELPGPLLVGLLMLSVPAGLALAGKLISIVSGKSGH
jgi:hypothetical protein